MWYFRKLPDGLVVMHTRPEHAPALEALQRICFPTLDDAERFKAPHYLKHLELFPDGQFVVLDADRVVGATTTLRLHFDFDHVTHTFADIIEGVWLTSHEPDGDWLYGADVGVDWGVFAAIGTIYLLPVLLIAFFLQGQLLRGATFGTVPR